MTKHPGYSLIRMLIKILLLGGFCIFILFWETHTYKRNTAELSRQAQVIAIDLWNLDPKGPIQYLEMAARLNNYETLTVFAVTNEQFAQVKRDQLSPINILLIKIGLIPKIHFYSDIFFNGRLVGRIEAVHLHTTIYLYGYLLIVIGLILLVSKFFTRTLQAKDTLDIRVNERTEELRLANQKLQEEEERYREIFNAPNDAIFLHDADTGKILDVNSGMLDMYGYSYDEVFKLDISNMSSGEHSFTQEEAARRLHDAVVCGPQVFEWRAQTKTGKHFWVEVSLKSTEFGNKKYIIAVARDIDNRKNAEQSLAAEKERLSVTLRSIGDGVITTGIDGNVVLMNKVAEELTGWAQSDAYLKSSQEVFHIINEKSRKRCKNPVDVILSTGNTIALEEQTILIAKDGSTKNIADSGAPIRDKESNIIGAVLVFRDVTQSLKMEEELLKGEKLESIAILAGGIAHDFNNILSAILGNIDLAMLDTGLKAKTKKQLADAGKAALRAKSLTLQLLTFSKGGDPIKETSAITEIIKDSAEFNLHGSNVICQHHMPENLWLVDIDRGQISQVIQNLVINAKQAMLEGGVIHITCENVRSSERKNILLPPEDYLKISFTDSGPGIPENIKDKIFDPFFSTKDDGSGLGLAICHSIITKHGGNIFVDSRPGKRTTFTIWLPASSTSFLKEEETERIDNQAIKARIIVMDDEQMIRDIAQSMLNALGHEVLLAENGEEAIALYKEQNESDAPVDIIIMDLTIPGGLGGKEAVKEILAYDPRAKLIVSSGYSNSPIMANSQQYGFSAAIVKPYQLKELNRVIEQVMI